MPVPSPGSPVPTVPERRVVAGVLTALWLVLWLGGYPRPNVDDSFFTGAGIHLATTGHLANPWIAGWMGFLDNVRPDKFLLQPPLYPVVLAGWIKMFGVSTASLTGFGCAAGWGASLAGWHLFRRVSGRATAAWIATALIATWVLFRGLRPEPLAVFCVAAGQLCLFGRRSAGGWFAGGLLGSAAVIFHPLWLIIVVPVTLLQLLDLRANPARVRLLAGLAASIALSALVLVAGLGSDFPVFVHDLTAHARFVAPKDGRLAIFLAHFRVGYDYCVNLLVLGLAVASLAASSPADRPAAWRAAGGLLLLLVLGFALYAAQSTVYIVLLGALVPLLVNRTSTSWLRGLSVAAPLVLTAWFCAQHSLQWLADRQHDARALRPAVLAYVASAGVRQVVFDATTLRTVFDYRPPDGALDLPWAWSPGREDRWWSPGHLAAFDLWVVNPIWSRNQLPKESGRDRFTFLGRPFHSVRSSRALLLVVGPGLPAPSPDLPFIRSATP